MQNVDFVTMDPVMECITQRTTTSEGCKVQFCNITQLMVCQNDPWLLHFRHSHHDTTWQTISLRKRGRQRTLTRLSLPQKYAQACALPKNKVTDVQSLLEYIPPIPHTFFNAINIDVHVPLTAVECIDPETDGDYWYTYHISIVAMDLPPQEGTGEAIFGMWQGSWNVRVVWCWCEDGTAKYRPHYAKVDTLCCGHAGRQQWPV